MNAFAVLIVCAFWLPFGESVSCYSYKCTRVVKHNDASAHYRMCRDFNEDDYISHNCDCCYSRIYEDDQESIYYGECRQNRPTNPPIEPPSTSNTTVKPTNANARAVLYSVDNYCDDDDDEDSCEEKYICRKDECNEDKPSDAQYMTQSSLWAVIFFNVIIVH